MNAVMQNAGASPGQRQGVGDANNLQLNGNGLRNTAGSVSTAGAGAVANGNGFQKLTQANLNAAT